MLTTKAPTPAVVSVPAPLPSSAYDPFSGPQPAGGWQTWSRTVSSPTGYQQQQQQQQPVGQYSALATNGHQWVDTATVTSIPPHAQYHDVAPPNTTNPPTAAAPEPPTTADDSKADEAVTTATREELEAFVAGLPKDEIAITFENTITSLALIVVEVLAERFAAEPALVLELCMANHGRMIAQMLKVLPELPASVQILEGITRQLPVLSYTKPGSATVVCIFDAAPPTLNLGGVYQFCCDNFVPLAVNDHGNNVLRHAFRRLDGPTSQQFAGVLSRPETMRALGTSRNGRNVIDAWVGTGSKAASAVASTVLQPEMIRFLAEDNVGSALLSDVIKLVKQRPAFFPDYQAIFAAIPSIAQGARFVERVTRLVGTRKPIKETRKDLARENLTAASASSVTTATRDEVEAFVASLSGEEVATTFDLAATPMVVFEALAARLATDGPLIRDLSLTAKGSRVLLHVVTALPGSPAVSQMIHRAVCRLLSTECAKAEYMIVGRVYDIVADDTRLHIGRFCVEHFMRLALHDHGSFVVRRVMTRMDVETAQKVTGILSQPDNVRALALSEPGASVLEVAFTDRTMVTTIVRILMRVELIRLLADHPHGKHVLRLAVRFVKSMPSATKEHQAVMKEMLLLIQGTEGEEMLHKLLTTTRRSKVAKTDPTAPSMVAATDVNPPPSPSHSSCSSAAPGGVSLSTGRSGDSEHDDDVVVDGKPGTPHPVHPHYRHHTAV